MQNISEILRETIAKMRKYSTKFSRIFEFGALDSQGAKVRKSCRSRQELSNEYLVLVLYSIQMYLVTL